MHEATPRESPPRRRGAAAVRLADGRVLAEEEVVWLPPFEPGTVIAWG
jgi:5-oxopent-3-ene-1,2,5-tricarboxylate decarboxylase/2-hydroxyhepta-2,4-diene-1,7-dioate isomerase